MILVTQSGIAKKSEGVVEAEKENKHCATPLGVVYLQLKGLYGDRP
jgi:hypothetical protein